MRSYLRGWLSVLINITEKNSMAEIFLHLANQERKDIVETLSVRLGRRAKVLEKDVWVCWALSALFSMPNAHRMAFKGGTSLSKIYKTINRFSEDVDITIDYQELAKASGDDFDVFALGQSRNQIGKFSERLKLAVRDYAHKQVLPHLKSQLNEFPNADEHRLEISENGEEIYIHYPSDVKSNEDYLLDSIKIELGGRNVIVPSKEHSITADIAEHVQGLEFPACDNVTALAAERTFWEKVTMLHTHCCRGEFKADPERLSRHWYDLYVLLQGPIAKRAVADKALLESVVEVKKRFFHTSYANYDACLNKGFMLTPTQSMIKGLQKDYAKMQEMIYADSPSFEEVLNALHLLETQLNA
jgi:hypothetical protein